MENQDDDHRMGWADLAIDPSLLAVGGNGLAYDLRHVDMLVAEKDPAWLAVNPGNFLPTIQDGEVTMVESVAILE